MLENEELSSKPIPFQLQFDKPISSQVKLAEWNPEKDLLAMVTEDSRVLLHRFNWQRLWTVNPGKCVTSLCWRPDGKIIALGLEDGTIAMHDVENGKLLRSAKSHNASVTCLNWEENSGLIKDESDVFEYEDRTGRFFPPSPRIPQMPGLVSGESSMDGSEYTFQDLSNSSHQRFNILCSGDSDGCICFSIFGIFPIGKINIQNLSLSTPFADSDAIHQLSNISINKVALSKDLCRLIIVGFGEPSNKRFKAKEKPVILHELVQTKNASSSSDDLFVGLHCFNLNTSIFHNRKNELHQVAQQASNIEDLLEVIRASLSVMAKHWSSAMNSYHDKFDVLPSLIVDHGLDSTPQDEFLSLLCGARTSPALNQFLVSSLGESGLKRVSKAIDSAGKEMHLIVHENLQPALEIIGFRVGELRGLSRWCARYKIIGLDEKLIDNATEKAGMFIVQVERFLRVLAIVMSQFHNFFNWLLRCIRILLSEQTDQIQPFNTELVVIFLKFLLDNDPVGQLLETHEQNQNIEVDLETMHRVEQLVAFGGFADTKYLERTLTKEFSQLEDCFKEAFSVPLSTVSKQINCMDSMPISPSLSSVDILASISYYKSGCQTTSGNLVDYICFKIPDETLDVVNYICIVKAFAYDSSNSLKAAVLCIPEGYRCEDMSLYKDTQLCLLLNETNALSADNVGSSLMTMIQMNDLSFTSVSRQACAKPWSCLELKDLAINLNLDTVKVRLVPHSVSKPLAVSASRGLACVFSSGQRALVYILDEDEDEASDTEEQQTMI